MKILRPFIHLLLLLLTANSFAETHETSHFLTIADIHFDPFLSCHSKPCPLIEKLQQAPANQWSSILATYATSKSEYGEDSNYSLLESSMSAIKKKASAENIQFAFVIGDYLAHNYDTKYMKYTQNYSKEGYRSFVKKTIIFLTEEIHQALPHTNIYFVVGNNDSYNGDYISDIRGQFFKDIGNLWGNTILNKNDRTLMQREFASGGYYAVNAPDENLHLIILNSTLFSAKAGGNKINQAANDELNWLHNELATAAKKHQKVFIIMHIPTGIDVYASLLNPFSIVEFWKPQYSQQFISEIKQSSVIIMGIFTAHVHRDTFEILNHGYANAISIIGSPAVSPIFNTNPGFKVFSYDTKSFQLGHFTSYFHPLNGTTEWSALTPPSPRFASAPTKKHR